MSVHSGSVKDAIASQKLDVTIPYCQSTITKQLALLKEEQWINHVNQRNYNGGWSVVPLRSLLVNQDAHPILQSFQLESGDEWCDLPLLEQLSCISNIVSSIPVDFKSIRLMRLEPKSEIKPHRDLGVNLENGEARLHVPLETSTAVTFVCNEQPLPMKQGELWYINADQIHSVVNQGDHSRINLVMDCKINSWLKARIKDLK